MKSIQSVIFAPLLLLVVVATLSMALPTRHSHISERAASNDNTPAPRSSPSIFTRSFGDHVKARYMKDGVLDERASELTTPHEQVNKREGGALVRRNILTSVIGRIGKIFWQSASSGDDNKDKRSLPEDDVLYSRTLDDQLHARYVKEDALEARGFKDFFKNLLGGIKDRVVGNFTKMLTMSQ